MLLRTGGFPAGQHKALFRTSARTCARFSIYRTYSQCLSSDYRQQDRSGGGQFHRYHPPWISRCGKAGMGSNTACSASSKSEIAEVPTGCEEEQQLLQALTSIPLITKAIVRPSPGSDNRVDITVSVARPLIVSNVCWKATGCSCESPSAEHSRGGAVPPNAHRRYPYPDHKWAGQEGPGQCSASCCENLLWYNKAIFCGCYLSPDAGPGTNGNICSLLCATFAGTGFIIDLQQPDPARMAGCTPKLWSYSLP